MKTNNNYVAPTTEMIRTFVEPLLQPVSVTENGQPSPDMGIGGDSPGDMEADAKRNHFNIWED